MKYSSFQSVCLISIAAVVQICYGYKFIMFSPCGSKSHLNNFYEMGEELVARGHDVTIVAGYPVRNGTKVKDIFIKSAFESFNSNPNQFARLLQTFKDPEEAGDSHALQLISLMGVRLPALCNTYLTEEKEFRKIIDAGMQYDVAINNYIFNECTLPLSFKVAKHVVLAGGAGMMSHFAYELNIPHPLSTNPNLMLGLPLEKPMNFKMRAMNAVINTGMLLLYRYYVNPAHDKVISAHFPDAMTVQETYSKVSLLLINRATALDGPMPSVPYVQEVAGMHTRPAKPLPKDFEKFIEGSGEAGFIYVSFGSVMPEEIIPEDKIQVFIKAFSKLPYRVIWKYKIERTDIPPNVMTIKWAPQQDVLGHPKCRAFVSHGGHASVDESVYHGVPILGMPLFADQPANTARSVIKGFAVELLWPDLRVETFVERINEIVTNPKYKQNAQSLSNLLKDQLETPTDRAVFWLEYVIRHDGAAHLRTAADHLNFVQYFLLDVIAAALLVVSLVLYVTYKLIRLIVCVACCRSKSSQKSKSKKIKKN